MTRLVLMTTSFLSPADMREVLLLVPLLPALLWMGLWIVLIRFAALTPVFNTQVI
jgi:hypothetical protein